uniref:Uncharacterized protein n=1 Tax=Lepeophtheirus salmonis TaxID=72036 RepID=A0A0K2TZD9_LEPSM
MCLEKKPRTTTTFVNSREQLAKESNLTYEWKWRTCQGFSHCSWKLRYSLFMNYSGFRLK